MSYVTGISGNVISAASAGWAPTNSAEVSAIASAYATGAAQVVTAVGTETAITPDGVGDVVTSINGNYISALSADSAFQASYDERGRELSSLPSEYDISSIASAYAASSQVVTSLQYATSESAIAATTVTADTAIGYGARDISAEYPFDDSWTYYESSTPLIKVRMTSDGNMCNYSSYPFYLYMVPYGATNQGSVSNTGDITGALAYGEFSGSMHDFLIAEGTGSAYSLNPSYVDVTFNVTHVPFVDSQPAWWGTVPGEHYAVVDDSENARPVFCVAGGWDGSQLFELRGNATAEVDFGSLVTVSAVSGINELEIAGAGGGIDSATVSAIASSYAEDVSAAASGAVSTVASNSASWMKPSNFSGLSGIVTAVGSSNMIASSFMGIDSAIRGTTGTIAGAFPLINYTAQLPDGISNEVIVYATNIHSTDTVDIYYTRYDGSNANDYMYVPGRDSIVLDGATGVISAMSRNRPFQLDFTAKHPEALAFQSDLTGAGVDSATVSAIASSYAESAVSSKLDESATADFYSTSNPSGFIDSAYAESAVSSKADSSALSSYALSADVSGTVDLVSTQSANWGGSALALSAGPGVLLTLSGNTLVASTDETVLWSNDNGAATFTASEVITNFERIAVYVTDNPLSESVQRVEIPMMGGNLTAPKFSLVSQWDSSWRVLMWWVKLTSSDMKSFSISSAGFAGALTNSSWSNGNEPNYFRFYKVVGINRISGA